MKRTAFTLAMVASLVALGQRAGAQDQGGVRSGRSAPQGEFGKLAELGYDLAVLFESTQPRAPIGFRGELSLSEFDSKSLVNEKTRIWSGIANALFTVPGIHGPYLICGLGIYHASAVCSGCSATGTRGGINGGGGYRFAWDRAEFFVEGRYHYIPGRLDPTNGGTKSSTQFMPISLGVSLR